MHLRFGPFKLYDHHIGDPENPYMLRWLFHHPFGTVRLHKITQADADPDLHDHPWDFVSFILRGGYTEDIGGPWEQHYGPGAISLKRASDAHRITSVDGPTWTLVFTGQRIRKWGFWTPEGWVAWDAYDRGVKGDVAAYRARLEEVGVVE